MYRGELSSYWRFSVAAIGLVGVATFAGIGLATSEPPLRVLTAAGVPLGFFLCVTAYGIEIAGRESPRHARLVTAIGVGSTIGYLTLSTWFFALVGYGAEFFGSSRAIYIAYGTASAGLGFGVVAGHHYVKYRAQARDLKRANAELRAQNDRLDEFASILSHDLRNPLAVANGYVELATETGNLDHLEDVKECHARIETLIEQVLALARMERDPDAVAPVDVAGVATDALETVDLDDAEIVVDANASVEAERSDLRQVFENCYRNAVEHAGPEPVVRVANLDHERGFAIADDGPGIPMSERDAVFERGYSNRDGTGLGLAIVGELADTYGWDVRVTESAGGGARFEFRTAESDATAAASTRQSTDARPCDAPTDRANDADAPTERTGDADAPTDRANDADAPTDRSETSRVPAAALAARRAANTGATEPDSEDDDGTVDDLEASSRSR